jgi:hypothetical protein
VRERLDYLRDGGRIYERSFAIIRAEADLSRFSTAEADVVVRMVHACGCVEVASAGMNHAHHHIGFLRRETREVRLGPNNSERALVNAAAVAKVVEPLTHRWPRQGSNA